MFMYKIEVSFAQNFETIFRPLKKLSFKKKFLDWNETYKTEHLVLKNHQLNGQLIVITVQK